jgi:hypothetical protein
MRFLISIVLFLIIFWSCVVIGLSPILQRPTMLVLEMEAAQEEVLQVFWMKQGDGFALERSRSLLVRPMESQYQVSLPRYGDYDTIRLDPAVRKTNMVVRSLEIVVAEKPVLSLRQYGDFNSHVSRSEGLTLKMPATGNGVLIASENNDPQLIMHVRTAKILLHAYGALLFAAAGTALAMLAGLAWLMRNRPEPLSWYNNRWHQGLLIVGCVLTVYYLILAIPIAVPQELSLPIWIAYGVIGTFWLYVTLVFFVSCKFDNQKEQVTGRYAWLYYALPSFVVFTLYLLAFWPASMSPDSLDQWKQLLRFSFKDWHPVFHTLILWAVTRVWLSPVMPALLQICMLAGACGWVLVRLRSLGVSPPMLLLIALFFALLPVNGLMAVTLWKDIPYSVAMMVLAVLLLELAVSSGVWLDSKKNACLLIVTTVCVSLFRHNGIFPAFGTLLVCILVFPRRWKQLLVVLLAAVSCHTIVRGPVYHWLDVDRDNPLSHITAKIERKAETMLKKLLFQEEKVDIKVAKPYWKGGKAAEFDEGLKRAVAVRLDSSSLLWRVRPLQGYYGRVDYVNLWQERSGDELQIRYISSNKLMLYESPILPMVTEWLFHVFERSKDSPWLFWMWRPAAFLYVLVFAAAVASLRHRKAIMLVMVPILFNSLPVLCFVSKSSIYRYHYAIVLTAIVLAFPLLFASLTTQDERP